MEVGLGGRAAVSADRTHGVERLLVIEHFLCGPCPFDVVYPEVFDSKFLTGAPKQVRQGVVGERLRLGVKEDPSTEGRDFRGGTLFPE